MYSVYYPCIYRQFIYIHRSTAWDDLLSEFYACRYIASTTATQSKYETTQYQPRVCQAHAAGYHRADHIRMASMSTLSKRQTQLSTFFAGHVICGS